MSATVKILGMRQPNGDSEEATIVNCCSNSQTSWERMLSPFLLGPCKLYQEFTSQNVENGWQFSKVYKKHLEYDYAITEEYFEWACTGWEDPVARRYPMGRGAKPEFSLWDGERLGYIDARKKIYGPLYSKAVLAGEGWPKLKALYTEAKLIVLRDFDGYDHNAMGMTLKDVLNNPSRKMGHAFVLKMLLTADEALKELVF